MEGGLRGGVALSAVQGFGVILTEFLWKLIMFSFEI